MIDWEGRLRPPGGLQDLSLLASAVPLRDEAGRVIGAVGVFSEQATNVASSWI